MTVGVLSNRYCSAASPASIVRRTRRCVSAMMSAMVLLPCRAIDRIDDSIAPRGIVTRAGLVEIFAATHTEPQQQAPTGGVSGNRQRSEEHKSEPQSLMRNTSAVFCLKNNNNNKK